MRTLDIVEVQAIEREIFPTPWPNGAYQTELSQNRQASYLVLRDGETLVGYGGMWRVGYEAHITTIGVRAADQHKGFGRALLCALIELAYKLGARWITLEVRATNDHAITLYEAFGFKVIGRRRSYYTDNSEDAIIMWSDNIFAPSFQTTFKQMVETSPVPGIGEGPLPEYPA